MRILRLDQILLDMFYRQGAVWALLAAVLLGALLFARIHRSIGIGAAMLMCQSVWYSPVHAIGSALRWWIIGLLLVRGVSAMSRVAAPKGERKIELLLVGMLAVWAVTTSAWSFAPLVSFAVAGTFAVGATLSVFVIWRLSDVIDFARLLGPFSMVLATTLFGSSFLVAAYALLADDFQLLQLTGVYGGRFSGVFTNANGVGVLGAILLPLLIGARRSDLGRMAKLRPMVVVLVAGMIFASGSRSATIGALMSVGVLMLYRYRAGMTFVGLFVVVCTGGAIALGATDALTTADLGIAEHVVRRGTLFNLGDRVQLWQIAWDAILERPWLGHGWAMSRTLEGMDVSGALERGKLGAGSNLHSAHLQLWVDAGVVGIVLFWGFGVLIAKRCMSIIARPPSDENGIYVVIVAALVVMWADSFVHGWVFAAGSPAAMVFWACCTQAAKDVERRRLQTARATLAADAARRAALARPVTVPALPRTAPAVG